MTLRLSARDAHALGLAKAPPKYGNEKLTVDGLVFDSILEANHWQMLKRRERAGEICQLCRQVRYPLHVNGVQIGVYVADFQWIDVKTGNTVVEDTKGYISAIYRRSKKHMKAQYGIEIVEVTA